MSNRWVLASIVAVGLAAVAISGRGKSAVTSQGEPAGACDPNAKAANFDFTMKDVDGNDVKLASYKGKVILLDFWATWCGPCKMEIPWFKEFHQKYQGKGFTVVGISSDDAIEQLKPFVAEYRMNYPVLQGLGRDDVHEAFGPVWGLPTTLIISRDGRICRKHLGLAPKAEFEKEILGLL